MEMAPGLFLKVAVLAGVALAFGLLVALVVKLLRRGEGGLGAGLLGLVAVVAAVTLGAYVFARRSSSFREEIALRDAARERAVAIRVADDYRAWKNAAILEPPQPQAVKEWVDGAAGSRIEQVTRGSSSATLRLPGPRDELVGYSSLEPNAEAALRGARNSVREQLRALIRWELVEDTSLDVQSPEVIAAVDEEVEKHLAQPGVELDRYERGMPLPQSGATAHRAAVLVKAPRNRDIKSIGKKIARELTKREESRSREVRKQKVHLGVTVAAAGLLGGATFLVYIFLNAGTRGHLAWPLRIGSLAVYLLICLGLLALRGHLP